MVPLTFLSLSFTFPLHLSSIAHSWVAPDIGIVTVLACPYDYCEVGGKMILIHSSVRDKKVKGTICDTLTFLVKKSEIEEVDVSYHHLA